MLKIITKEKEEEAKALIEQYGESPHRLTPRRVLSKALSKVGLGTRDANKPRQGLFILGFALGQVAGRTKMNVKKLSAPKVPVPVEKPTEPTVPTVPIVPIVPIVPVEPTVPTVPTEPVPTELAPTPPKKRGRPRKTATVD